MSYRHEAIQEGRRKVFEVRTPEVVVEQRPGKGPVPGGLLGLPLPVLQPGGVLEARGPFARLVRRVSHGPALPRVFEGHPERFEQGVRLRWLLLPIRGGGAFNVTDCDTRPGTMTEDA